MRCGLLRGSVGTTCKADTQTSGYRPEESRKSVLWSFRMTIEMPLLPYCGVTNSHGSQEIELDPTHFLASQGVRQQNTARAAPSEIDAFYDQNALDRLAALSRWRARTGQAWRRIAAAKPTSAFAQVIERR